MSRKADRELVIRCLYQIDLVNLDVQTVVADLEEDDEKPSDFVVESLENITARMETIDRLIEDNLTEWKLNRLAYLDRAIIRMAAYEMLYGITPNEIAINEAVELTKKYTDIGDGKSKAFNNKVLDNIRRTLDATK